MVGAVKGGGGGGVEPPDKLCIVKVVVKAACQQFRSWCILEEMTVPVSPFRTMPQEPWHPGKGAKSDQVMLPQLCGSYKTTKIWENLNNEGTKMIFLADKL